MGRRHHWFQCDIGCLIVTLWWAAECWFLLTIWLCIQFCPSKNEKILWQISFTQAEQISNPCVSQTTKMMITRRLPPLTLKLLWLQPKKSWKRWWLDDDNTKCLNGLNVLWYHNLTEEKQMLLVQAMFIFHIVWQAALTKEKW